MLGVKWVRTTVDVYLTIYNKHRDDFGVFESCTYRGGSEWGATGTHIETAWGFKDAPCGLIKSIGKGPETEVTEWQYFIAIPIENES